MGAQQHPQPKVVVLGKEQILGVAAELLIHHAAIQEACDSRLCVQQPERLLRHDLLDCPAVFVYDHVIRKHEIDARPLHEHPGQLRERIGPIPVVVRRPAQKRSSRSGEARVECSGQPAVRRVANAADTWVACAVCGDHLWGLVR